MEELECIIIDPAVNGWIVSFHHKDDAIQSYKYVAGNVEDICAVMRVVLGSDDAPESKQVENPAKDAEPTYPSNHSE